MFKVTFFGVLATLSIVFSVNAMNVNYNFVFGDQATLVHNMPDVREEFVQVLRWRCCA